MEAVNLTIAVLCFLGMFIPRQERVLTVTMFLFFVSNLCFGLSAFSIDIY